jgi:hypothetical protein
MRAWRGLGAAALVAAGCVHLDTRTAVEHEQEAARHRANADQVRAATDIAQRTLPVVSASDATTNPGAPAIEVAAGRYAREAAAAQEHEDAAHRLRDQAARYCRHIPVAEQQSCPLPPGARVEPLARGLRIVPLAPVTAATLRERIDCALANAQVDHPSDWATCPLYAPGATTQVLDRADIGAVVEIHTLDEAQATEARRRAALVVSPPK